MRFGFFLESISGLPIFQWFRQKIAALTTKTAPREVGLSIAHYSASDAQGRKKLPGLIFSRITTGKVFITADAEARVIANQDVANKKSRIKPADSGIIKAISIRPPATMENLDPDDSPTSTPESEEISHNHTSSGKATSEVIGVNIAASREMCSDRIAHTLTEFSIKFPGTREILERDAEDGNGDKRLTNSPVLGDNLESSSVQPFEAEQSSDSSNASRDAETFVLNSGALAENIEEIEMRTSEAGNTPEPEFANDKAETPDADIEEIANGAEDGSILEPEPEEISETDVGSHGFSTLAADAGLVPSDLEVREISEPEVEIQDGENIAMDTEITANTTEEISMRLLEVESIPDCDAGTTNATAQAAKYDLLADTTEPMEIPEVHVENENGQTPGADSECMADTLEEIRKQQPEAVEIPGTNCENRDAETLSAHSEVTPQNPEGISTRKPEADEVAHEGNLNTSTPTAHSEEKADISEEILEYDVGSRDAENGAAYSAAIDDSPEDISIPQLKMDEMFDSNDGTRNLETQVGDCEVRADNDGSKPPSDSKEIPNDIAAISVPPPETKEFTQLKVTSNSVSRQEADSDEPANNKEDITIPTPKAKEIDQPNVGSPKAQTQAADLEEIEDTFEENTKEHLGVEGVSENNVADRDVETLVAVFQVLADSLEEVSTQSSEAEKIQDVDPGNGTAEKPSEDSTVTASDLEEISIGTTQAQKTPDIAIETPAADTEGVEITKPVSDVGNPDSTTVGGDAEQMPATVEGIQYRPNEAVDEDTVYYTRYGKRYHKKRSCHSMRRSITIRSGKKKNAPRKLTPCKNCYPG